MPGIAYAVIEAPSILGLKPTGVERLSEVLLGNGLASRLGAVHAARVSTPPYDPRPDPATRTLNARAMAGWSSRLADEMQQVLDSGRVPLVLGGDCSILLGTMLALKRSGRYGLLFIDGHADFYQVEANPNGEAASMELAFATGRGPELLSNLEGRGPLVRDEDVVVFGYRDAQQQAEYGSQSLPDSIRSFELETVRRIGAPEAARQAVAHLLRPELDGFFLHFDADCLSDEFMPAVDYRLEGGLLPQEAQAVLKAAAGSGRLAGVEVTIYNPELDQDGSAGRLLTDILVGGLA